MKQTNQMNGLYPIIRRVRRPLLPVEAPADAKPAVAPAKAEQETYVAKETGQRMENDERIDPTKQGD